MSLRRSWLTLPILVAALAGFAPHARAASERTYLAGGYTVAGFPLGDWGKIAGFALGIDGTNLTYLSPEKPLAIHSSFGFIYNFSRTQGVPQANLGPNSKLDLETKNGTLYFGVGPELGKVSGPVNPFVFGTVGFNTYWTASTLSGTAGGTPYAAKFGDSRIAFAWAAGAGIRKHVTKGETVELSAEYRSGGGHMFVLPDEITNNGAAVNANRKARTTDQLLVKIGTVIGY